MLFRSNDYVELGRFIETVIKPLNDGFSAPLDKDNYVTDSIDIVRNKNPFSVTLCGVKTASEVGIVKHIPGKTAHSVFFPAGYNDIPNVFQLEQNYPNPFNPTTTIRYSLQENSVVTLTIFDVLGREVAILLANQQMQSGEHEIEFDATSLSSGVYFYQLSTPVFSQTKKLLLMK